MEHISRAPMLHRLTGIRAVAAMFVVGSHYGDSFGVLFPIFLRLRPLYRIGGNGVDLFFILSGFILCHNYLDRFQTWSYRKYVDFLRARLARVYPVHLATLLILTAIVLLASSSGKPLNAHHYGKIQWLANALLIQGWPAFGKSLSWNYPAWSVSAEWFAYLIFPLAAMFAGQLRRPGIWAAMCLAVYLVPASFGWIPDSAPSQWSLLRITSEFVCGTCLYRLFQSGRPSPLSPSLAGGVAIGLTLCFSLLRLHGACAVPAYALLIWSLADRPDGLLGGRVAVYLGQASYSLYMTHGVVQIVLNRVCPVAHFAAATLPVRSTVLAFYLASIIAATALTYHFVEIPGRRMLLARRAGKREGVSLQRELTLTRLEHGPQQSQIQKATSCAE